MAFQRIRQVRTRADCDGCGDQWLNHARPDLTEPTFPTRGQARRFLTHCLGWAFTREGMWCGDCAHRRRCAEEGHLMETDPVPEAWVCGTVMPALRFCRRCDHYEPLTQPPATLLAPEEETTLILTELQLRDMDGEVRGDIDDH